MQKARDPASFPLHLDVEAEGQGLNIRWNPQSVPVTQAREGHLVITEPGQPAQIITLDSAELTSGHVYYQSSAERLEFRLEVLDRSETTAKDSVLALSSKPGAPLSPQPVGRELNTIRQMQSIPIPDAASELTRVENIMQALRGSQGSVEPRAPQATPSGDAKLGPAVAPHQDRLKSESKPPQDGATTVVSRVIATPAVSLNSGMVRDALPLTGIPPLEKPPATTMLDQLVAEGPSVASRQGQQEIPARLPKEKAPPTDAVEASQQKLGEETRGVIAPAAAAPAEPIGSTEATQPKPSIASRGSASLVGTWTYPVIGGLYHGQQPEFAEMVVQDQNGHLSGTLFARFKLQAGNTGDPVVRFSFSGDFRNIRIQMFHLLTSDGAQGTVELIPGPGSNLLEVNFQTESTSPMRRGNMMLVKK